MRSIQRYVRDQFLLAEGEAHRLIAMMGLFFLVVCAVGILRPIKNALALDGLGATDFYKVYLVSAVVVLFVPVYGWLADRVAPRWLIPGIALFFATNLLGFRLAFRTDSPVLGVIFYGWYDLFAAVLVSQFFMATQLFFNARNAKHAYPLVIAGGSVGATLGGAITGFFAETVGTANLLLVAASFIALFGLALPFVWSGEAVPAHGARRKEALSAREFRKVLANRHVRLIAATVLLTVVVKQLVDYQFNALTMEVFQTPDAVSAFQGKFNAATQWLPFVVVMGLRPLMRRWGVGAAVFLLPATLMLATIGLALWWSLAFAVLAKAADSSLRYSAERTGREILYVPVPEEIKLKAKAYIDVAVEKGLGKVLAAGLIFVLLEWMDYRQIAYVAAGLTVVWLLVAIEIRREYIRALAHSIEGRFASLRGVFASISDASTLAAIRNALTGQAPLQVNFALELLDQTSRSDLASFASDLHRLLDHPAEEVRLRALATLAKVPEALEVERVRELVRDHEPAVRQAAVRAWCTARPAERETILGELLESPEAPVRTAALACLALGEVSVDGVRLVMQPYLDGRRGDSAPRDAGARIELALAAGALRHQGESTESMLEPLLQDPDPEVASAALRSAGLLGRSGFYPCMVEALGTRETRAAAREALASQGEAVVDVLCDRLLDETTPPAVRRSIPSVLARIPARSSVMALLRSIAAPETDQFLDYRTLKALNKLRARHPELVFEPPLVLAVLDREVECARRYAQAGAALRRSERTTRAGPLLLAALEEGWRERREDAFRCLGLLYPPREVHRCYLAVVGQAQGPRANGLEWLDQTLGYSVFRRLAPVLGERAVAPPEATPERLGSVLGPLSADEDAWIARCASAVAVELGLTAIETKQGSDPMDAIEKVFLLQQVDLLRGARSAHLALLASIAEETEVPAGEVLIRQGESTDSMYVVVRGAVELQGLGGQTVQASDGASFGTWALIDEAASLVEATAVEPSHLLRIGRDEFYDLLADYPELAMGMLQGLAHRVRTLVA